MLPAHRTKHLPLLVDYPFGSARFSLSQTDDGRLKTTGSTLWLGSQVLSLYLRQVVSTRIQLADGLHRPVKVIELGSGIGLSALALASLGCDVVATDVKNVISTVLDLNISNNLPNLPPLSGMIQVRELDWTIPPDQWTWDDQNKITSSSTQSSNLLHKTEDLSKPPFDLIITSDTLYHPDLVSPLFRSIHALSTASSSLTLQSPVIYLCVERRDPMLIDRALLEAKETWGFKTERIAHKKLVKVIEKAEIKWDREDWEGIEIWKLLSTRIIPDSS